MTAILDVDFEQLERAFAHHPLAVRHSLAGHPDLAFEAITRLAERLRPKDIERHHCDLPLVVPGGAPELNGPPTTTERAIADSRTWMVLWFIEQVREYRDLLWACVSEVAKIVGDSDGGVSPRRREAFLFVSSPGSTTPVHFDPEQNLLLQIAGSKEVSVAPFGDSAAETRELLRYYDGGHRNLEQMPTGRAAVFKLTPGNGVYIPPFAPHWVHNGPEPSISLSLTFRSRASERRECVHELNARLRRMGLTPRLPGEHGAIDRAKTAAVLLARGGKRWLAWLRELRTRLRQPAEVSP